VILIFVKGSYAFTVYYENFERLFSLSLNFYRLGPDPQALFNLTAIYLITFVHGLIVGPTPKPLLLVLFNIILLRRNDLPVLYLPATAITPMRSLTLLRRSIASGLT
jgi:hypothetical protein